MNRVVDKMKQGKEEQTEHRMRRRKKGGDAVGEVRNVKIKKVRPELYDREPMFSGPVLVSRKRW